MTVSLKNGSFNADNLPTRILLPPEMKSHRPFPLVSYTINLLLVICIYFPHTMLPDSSIINDREMISHFLFFVEKKTAPLIITTKSMIAWGKEMTIPRVTDNGSSPIQ